MGNIINITSKEIFGLDIKNDKPSSKKTFIRPKTIILRGKGLYAFIR
jgi:hypothetical protein